MVDKDFPQLFIDAATTASRFVLEFGRGAVVAFYPPTMPNKIAHTYLTIQNIIDGKLSDILPLSSAARTHLIFKLNSYNPQIEFILVHVLPDKYQEMICIPYKDTGVTPP